mmetsp:Transcript_2588/g.4979  ORF Transcript_2588/g.4979 Transcript_2588/m.4979 type:complete len:491 (-) Transcript_2588:471-1943(-)
MGGHFMKFHRPCCHRKEIRMDEEGRPVLNSRYNTTMENLQKCKKRKVSNTITTPELKKKYENAMKEENQHAGDSTLADIASMSFTDERYMTNLKIFEKCKNAKHPMVVLDLFSGIGSVALCLKRVGLKMKTVISVDHDPLAQLVYKYNHREDGIHHIYEEKFEDILENIGDILSKYGPIDLIVGGPPCVDYSLVNANRKGINGSKGKYMLQFARLIKTIREHEFQNNRHLFYLCENVELRDNDAIVCDQEFGVSPFIIDAKSYSPCKRKRSYYTNIPYEGKDEECLDAESCVKSILEDDWMHPADAYDSFNSVNQPFIYKANTFLASSSRLDDIRMLKVKLTDNGNFQRGFYSVSDREKMMGFPVGYVENVVKKIFNTVEKAMHSEYWWIETFPFDQEDVENLSGLGFKYESSLEDNSPVPKIKIAGREVGSNGEVLYYFNCDEYSKHLIGNAFSIPVVEHLLTPLKKVFESCEYDNANYHFAWPPHCLV